MHAQLAWVYKLNAVAVCTSVNSSRSCPPSMVLPFRECCQSVKLRSYAEGYRMDGRKWRIDYATKDDYKFFGWKWTEGGKDDRSPSR